MLCECYIYTLHAIYHGFLMPLAMPENARSNVFSKSTNGVAIDVHRCSKNSWGILQSRNSRKFVVVSDGGSARSQNYMKKAHEPTNFQL